MTSPPASSPDPDNHAPLLVGRERERALLDKHLAAAVAGRGGLVLIGGEAGIGKTALAEALTRDARARGALVLVGRCYDLTETPPYGPWVELFERLPIEHDRTHLPAPFGGGEAASQAALFAQVRDFLTALAGQRPLVLLLDDLHWADPASLDFLRSLARQVASLPILLLVTYRADEVGRRHPLAQLLPALVREAGAARLELRPVTREDFATLVRARYALPPDDEARLAAYLHDRTEGNPFFAWELFRTVEEEGALRQDAGAWRLGELGHLRVPTLLRQVIDGRLTRLGEEARRLLAVAAVVGQEAPLDLWAAAAAVDEEALADPLERATEASILVESAGGASVRFSHALIRETLYETTPAVQRRRQHRQVGELLASGPSPDPDAVAYHLRQAGDSRAANWLIKAGERAQRAYAWLTAAERFEAALALLEQTGADPGERGLLLLRLARLRRYADTRRSLGYLEEGLRLADAVGDRALAGLMRFQRGMLHCFVEEMRRGVAEMEAGAAAMDALSPAERARLRTLCTASGDDPDEDYRATLVTWLAIPGRFAEALRLGERVVAEANAMGAARGQSGAAVADAYAGLADAHAALGRPDEARRWFERTRGAYRAIEHYVQVALAALNELELVALPYRADHLAERRQLASEAEEAWRRARGALADLAPGTARLPLLLVEGHWDEARQLAQAVRSAGPNYSWLAARHLGPLARDQGDSTLAWAMVRQQLSDGPGTPPGDRSYPYTLPLLRLAAALALDAGDLTAARAWLDAHECWLEWNGTVLGRAEGQLGWAAYRRAAGDHAQARDHAELAMAHATEPRQPLALLAAHRLLGELHTAARRLSDAERHLSESLALAEACAAPFERALTLLALAELRGASGDRAGASQALDEARGILAALEARPALARAEALAARLAEAAPVSPAYPAGLTAREVEVLHLVAAGLTDAQVAERLYLSPRTVSTHLTSIYTKLGVSSRLAAARFALDHRLA